MSYANVVSPCREPVRLFFCVGLLEKALVGETAEKKEAPFIGGEIVLSGGIDDIHEIFFAGLHIGREIAVLYEADRVNGELFDLKHKGKELFALRRRVRPFRQFFHGDRFRRVFEDVGSLFQHIAAVREHAYGRKERTH